MRNKKLERNIRVTIELRIQRLLEQQDRLVQELEMWRKQQETQLVGLRQKCMEMADTFPADTEARSQSTNNVQQRVWSLYRIFLIVTHK